MLLLTAPYTFTGSFWN